MQMKRWVCLLLCVAFLNGILSGCDLEEKPDPQTGTVSGQEENPGTQTGTASDPADADFSKTDADMFTQRDKSGEYTQSGSVAVDLSSGTAGPGVKISGSTVTVTGEGTYILTGSLEEGQILVDAGDKAKVQLVLDGVEVHSSTSAALYILSADKVFVTLAEGTQNSLRNGGSFLADGENNIDGAIYSKEDLTFNGSGSLTVTSPAGHGIVCKDDLVFTGGIYRVTSASHGLDANDSVRIAGADLTVDAGKDGIHVENNDDTAKGFVYISGGKLKIEGEGDGISASYYIQINDGSFDLHCGGGYQNGTKESSGGYGGFMGGKPGGGGSSTSTESDGTSMKGLKAGSGILIDSGTFVMDTADDAVHAASDIIVNGGNWKIASGDDGFHSDTMLTVTAGAFTLTNCYEGLEAEKIYIQGGEFEIHATDDGLNAAGGTDSSGTGGRDEMFGGGRPGGPGGGFGGGNENACIEVSGGSMKIYSGGDGLDSNGKLLISGGYTYVTNPTSGDVSVLDSDMTPVITGGTYIGLAISTMMAETFGGESTQGVIACTCGTQAAGSALVIKDSSGKEILSLATEYRTVLIIISTPQIISGESYDISIGTVSGTMTAG